MKKTTAIFVTLLMGPNLSVLSQENNPSSPDDPIARTTRLAKTISDLTARINSDDPAIRAAAIEIALSNESPSVRCMALAEALSRFNTLIPKIIVGRENPIEPGDLPNIAITIKKWSESRRSFVGYIDLGGPSNIVNGQVSNDQLSIEFSAVKLSSRLLQNIRQAGMSNENPRQPAEILTKCNAHLEPNESRNALEGDMTCGKLPVRFHLRLGFLG